ncbi:glycoside hydrolase family 47 protein [Streptacidiphilus griseoplanus]|uniref:glycoside hydrolase family 47 protein n=1 Tax=Peterkaempfera griseoplana TaxID=66896 RepID=UPI0006E137E2|nr:glycoside hydrolase family 47 protein [Peterkaempfera griseoplana]
MRSLSSAALRARLPRRGVLGAAAATALATLLPARPAAAAPRSVPPAATPGRAAVPSDPEVARQVKAEFVHSWEGYKRGAWGHDELRPLSAGHNDFYLPGRTFGLSIVEALDTLYVMELDHEVKLAADWIERHLDPAQDGDIHVFEAVIRLVGGLLSGHLCTGRPQLLQRCRELTDRLLPAFTASPTGIPYTHVNLRTGAVSGTNPPLAEIGSNILEFGLLSQLTGDSRYYDAAKRAYRAVLERRSSLDLLGTTLDTESGRWLDTASVAPNPPVDSFYEYLWAGGELFGDRELSDWYRLLTDAVLRVQSQRRNGRLWFAQVDAETGRTIGHGQSELGSFYAGLLGKGGNLAQGADYHRTWTALLDTYPLLPEAVDFTRLQVTSPRNDLRPEYANSAFDLWRLTGDAAYKRSAYRYFRGLRDHLRVPGGYTVAADVTSSPVQLGDLTPGYWFAENPKYLYLMFARSPRFDQRGGLLSTEGKILRGAVRAK